MTDHPNITLSTGSHRTRDDGMCMMEAAAMLAGEPHTDRPKCVDPVIAAFCRTWQDRLDDEQRADLAAPLVGLVIGTRTTPEDQDRRAIMVGDWCWRTVLPMWLDLVPGLGGHAAALRAHPEATTAADLAALTGGVGAAARAAAWAAARDAASAAAAASDAASDAAWAAASAAARAVLDPTVRAIQETGADLIRRMCEVGR